MRLEGFFLARELSVVNSSIDRLGLNIGESHPLSNPVKSVIDVFIKNRGYFAGKLIAGQCFFLIRHTVTEEGSKPFMVVDEFVIEHRPYNPEKILCFFRLSDTDAGIVMKPRLCCPKIHSGADSVNLRKVLPKSIINGTGGGNNTDALKRIG